MNGVIEETDVLVIGSGHAGIEAALAATRIGARTMLLTQNLDTIGQMSCNPAIGGSAKGHIVKEIDALGGAMGLNADATGIQFRRLNRSKGPAVWATRVQCDKKAYQFRMKALLERMPSLRLLQGTASRVLTKGDEITGVESSLGGVISAKSIVITAGTFLRGLLHVGQQTSAGGRMGDTVSSGLSQSLGQLGIEVRRFKTGTPCRLNARSIDFRTLEVQNGDEPPPRFASVSERRSADDFFTLNFDPEGVFHVEQLPCWITRSTPETHLIIESNLSKSPLYQGRIEGIGPRYCPSIEDKIVRFKEKSSHQIFLEPESRHSEEIYVNGVSTSLPYDVQQEFIHSIPGLERAEIIRPGYAVEYDYFPPDQLTTALESKAIGGLFFAGQVNGTSGYEEAAGQGLVAGANAALRAAARSSFLLERETSYIGVMIHDLTTSGTDEPYRMFTSRAEHRLTLREDNADLRLTDIGAAVGLVDEQRIVLLQSKRAAVAAAEKIISSERIGGRLLRDEMRDPRFSISSLPPELRSQVPEAIWQHVATEAKYSGYISRQAREISQAGNDFAIPSDIDFNLIPGLRNESRQRLARFRPASGTVARQIPGMTAADISLIRIWLKNNSLSIIY